MFRLPLFPLPVVLFPGAAMPLHVFEPRYRRMVSRCLERDRHFGLVYHDADREGPFLTEEGRVGCTAEIESHKPLPDGRSLILVRGSERFLIRDGVESEAPYYEAVVEPYEDRPPSPGTGPTLLEKRRCSVRLFRAAVEAMGEEDDPLPDLSIEKELSFPLASVLRIDPDWQQAFLELRDEAQRLERLDAIFHVASQKTRSRQSREGQSREGQSRD